MHRYAQPQFFVEGPKRPFHADGRAAWAVERGSHKVYIDEDMIADAISELFCYRVPKRLAEYWGDQYVGITSVRHIKSVHVLGRAD